MPLFGKSSKGPAELVRALREAVAALERGDKKADKAQEDVSKNLVSTQCSELSTQYPIPNTQYSLTHTHTHIFLSPFLPPPRLSLSLSALITGSNQSFKQMTFVNKLSKILYLYDICATFQYCILQDAICLTIHQPFSRKIGDANPRIVCAQSYRASSRTVMNEHVIRR